MKILQTPPRFYPYIGGVENAVYYLSRELSREGHRVRVICANEPAAGSGDIGGVSVKRLSWLGKIGNTNITFGLPAALIKEDFDLIHTHLPTPWSADWSAAAAFFKNKPLFLSYYNDICGTGINNLAAGAYNSTALKFLLRRAKKIFLFQKNTIFTSPFLKPFQSKIVVVAPGVDTDKFSPLEISKPEGKFVIFFLAKLDKFHQYKGLEYLLRALKEISGKVPALLYIGGSGEMEGYYKKIARDNGIGDSVKFLGLLAEEQLRKYYNTCDVFVLPSVSSALEGFGLVAQEAMACGKPVVITDIAGMAEELKASGAGIVVRPENSADLAEALVYLFSHPQEARAMGARALSLIREKFTWRKHALTILSEYQQALK